MSMSQSPPDRRGRAMPVRTDGWFSISCAPPRLACSRTAAPWCSCNQSSPAPRNRWTLWGPLVW